MDTAAPTISRLKHLESVIERGQQTFIEVGLALAEIRDSKLYRQDFATFEDYCKERWGWSASRSRRLITSAEAVAAMQSVPIGTPVTNEGQARELAKIKDPELRADIWQQANEIAVATQQKVTAKLVHEAVTTLTSYDAFIENGSNTRAISPPVVCEEPMDRPRQAPAEALWLWGRLCDFEREGYFDTDINEVVGQMSPRLQSDVRRIVPQLLEWLGGLE